MTGLPDRLEVPRLDHRSLDRRVDVLEEHDDVIPPHDRARRGGATPIVAAMEARDRVRDREPWISRRSLLLVGGIGHRRPKAGRS
jgi:hypothetical protein